VHLCGTPRRTTSVQVNEPAESRPRGAAFGVARHCFWQIAGKTLAAHQHDSDTSSADPDTSLWHASLPALHPGAHPYHESCTHRCADQRFRRSPPTVDRQVMCSSLAGHPRGSPASYALLILAAANTSNTIVRLLSRGDATVRGGGRGSQGARTVVARTWRMPSAALPLARGRTLASRWTHESTRRTEICVPHRF
jgi:hypothetical protein